MQSRKRDHISRDELQLRIDGSRPKEVNNDKAEISEVALRAKSKARFPLPGLILVFVAPTPLVVTNQHVLAGKSGPSRPHQAWRDLSPTW